MQAPIFEEYGIDEKLFWKEINLLPEYYHKRGQTVLRKPATLITYYRSSERST